METKKINRPSTGNKYEIMRFIFPEGNNNFIFKEDDLQQSFNYNNCYPDFLIMREESGLVSMNCFFTIYIFQMSGSDLNVISCIQYTRSEKVEFNAGYTYIRVPVLNKTEQWEYRINDTISANCQSSRSLIRINDHYREMLQVNRYLSYKEPGMNDINRVIEFYLHGTGVYRVKYFRDKNPSGKVPSNWHVC